MIYQIPIKCSNPEENIIFNKNSCSATINIAGNQLDLKLEPIK